jgi:hypothetical protein
MRLPFLSLSSSLFFSLSLTLSLSLSLSLGGVGFTGFTQTVFVVVKGTSCMQYRRCFD